MDKSWCCVCAYRYFAPKMISIVCVFISNTLLIKLAMILLMYNKVQLYLIRICFDFPQAIFLKIWRMIVYTFCVYVSVYNHMQIIKKL